MSQQKIVLVENDEDDIEFMSEAFHAVSSSKYELLVFNDGQEAIDFLSNVPNEQLPCLLVLDCNMPGISCIEILEVLANQERYKQVPKFILSTSASPQHIENCVKKGAIKYFVKPHTFDGYQPIVAEMISACSQTK